MVILIMVDCFPDRHPTQDAFESTSQRARNAMIVALPDSKPGGVDHEALTIHFKLREPLVPVCMSGLQPVAAMIEGI
ncbi:MAG: hypothetical protein ABWY14_19285 [Tardiphaga sp.]